MRLLVLSILLCACKLSFGNSYVQLQFKIIEEFTERPLETQGWDEKEKVFSSRTYVTIYSADTIFRTDTASFFGLGGFTVPVGGYYTFEVGHPGYVSKRGDVDLREYPDSLDWRTYFMCWVSLFPECENGDYEFMKTESLIKFYLNSDREQDWDRDYAAKMAKRVEDAHFSNFSPEDKKLHLSVMEDAKTHYENEDFETALGIFENAENYVSCGLVQILIQDCERKIAKKQRFKDFVKEGDQFFDAGKYTKAQKKYQEAVTLYPQDTYVGEQLEKLDELLSKKKLK